MIKSQFHIFLIKILKFCCHFKSLVLFISFTEKSKKEIKLLKSYVILFEIFNLRNKIITTTINHNRFYKLLCQIKN